MNEHGLTLDRRPELRDPALVVAFAGWNDAGEAASAAVRWLVRRLPGQRFASIEPEEYHDFTGTRPTVRLVNDERRITWPVHDAYYHTDPAQPRDLALFVAVEPELRWRSYCEALLDLVREVGATTLVTLGAFQGDTLHNRPVPLSGFATDVALRDRLPEIGALYSNYEGPTGITGALHQFASQAGLPSVSLWAAVPHYLPTTANPKAALALVRGLSGLLGLDLDLRRLEAAAAFFQRQVDQAISQDRRATGYLRALERRTAIEPQTSSPEETPTPLPSAEDVIRDLERFLRTQGKGDGEEE